VKRFTGWNPRARFTVAQAFTRATSRAAGRFLGKVVDALPFPVRAMQVDGGSEFMAEFEKACRARETSSRRPRRGTSQHRSTPFSTAPRRNRGSGGPAARLQTGVIRFPWHPDGTTDTEKPEKIRVSAGIPDSRTGNR